MIADLDHRDETDRLYAVEDLACAGALEAVAPLVERLGVEPSRKVRETIFLALERIDSPEVLLRAAALLDSDDAFLRNQAVGLLQRKGAASAPVLMARMRDADPDVRKFVVDTAAGIQSPEVEPIFDAAMRDADINVVIAALEYLGEQRKTRFKSSVEAIFAQATEPMLVCAAFAALLRIGDDVSWDCIRGRYPTAAQVPLWELSWWVRALGEFGAPGEIEVFHESLCSRKGKMIGDTVDALERFQARHGRVAISEAFWATLRETLAGPLAAEVRLQLLRVVGGFGTPAAISDYLVELLEHGDRPTQLAAIEGIKRLDRPVLMAQLRARSWAESEAEIVEALGEAEGHAR